MGSGASEVSRHDVAGSSETTIEIKVKTMDSQTYTLQVDKQMSVPALKEQIASVTGVVTEHQRLICRGKVLKDDQLLSAYHVEDGHTLHLVVREPASSSSGSLPSDPALDRSSSGTRGQFYQVAPGVVIETFNMPGQGDRVLPDISRIISAVLGSIGVTNPASAGEGNGARDQSADGPGEPPAVSGSTDTNQTLHEQSGMRGQNDRSRFYNAFGTPPSVSFGSLQGSVIPDALTTLSQYMSHMRQEFINTGRVSENTNGTSNLDGNVSGSSSLPPSESTPEVLPSPASLAELLSSTRQMLNQQTEECLLQMARQLENQANVTDPAARASAQSGALRTGILLQNLGSYFLELGRTVTTLRLGRSPSEAVVNAGPAVFISPSGPNPLMVQPLPFQPGASFSSSLSGGPQSGSGVVNGLGSGFVPRRIDIQIRRGPSSHQTEPAASRQASGQTLSSSNVSVETPVNQPPSGASGATSSNTGAAAVRILPLRSMLAAAVPDLNRVPSESAGDSLGGMFYPVLGRYPFASPSGNLSATGSQASGEHNSSGTVTEPHIGLASVLNAEGPTENGQRVPVVSRTIDINILSTGGPQNDPNSEEQVPPGILQFLRGLFPGGEIHVENVGSQGTAMGPEQGRSTTTAAAAQEAEPRATEEGIFLSRLLQQVMPLISQDSGTEQNAAHHGEGDDATQCKDGSSSSTSAEASELGTSRRQDDQNPGAPNPKRQKRE